MRHGARTIITLASGTMETLPGLDGWIITSPTAVADQMPEESLIHGDRITLNGDVWRGSWRIASLS